jgi:hypothetical protein
MNNDQIPQRRIVRSFTAEAIVIGILASLVIGAIAGLAMGLLLNSICAGLLFLVIIMLLSIDVIFQGVV